MLAPSLLLYIAAINIRDGIWLGTLFSFILLVATLLANTRLYPLSVIGIPVLIYLLGFSVYWLIDGYEGISVAMIILVSCVLYLVGVVLVAESIIRKRQQASLKA